MATLTVDTDGESGTYATLADAIAALPNPFTENMTITCAASTGVADTAEPSINIDTTTDYRLTIIGSSSYILETSGADHLEIVYTSGDYQNVTLKNLNITKAAGSATANYQYLVGLGTAAGLRLGRVIIDSCNFVGDTSIGSTYRDRFLYLNLNTSYTFAGSTT